MTIDFAKLLWEKFNIKYGPKDSYCDYPKRFNTRGIRISCVSNESNIALLSFSLNRNKYGLWLKIEEGGVTGYESILFKDLKNHKNDWFANLGNQKYDSLLLKKKDIALLIKDIEEFLSEYQITYPKEDAIL